MLAGDRDRKMWESVEIVSGAVERVDYPSVIFTALDFVRFLGEYAVAGKRAQQGLNNFLIVRAFKLDFEVGQLVHFADNMITCTSRGSNCNIQHGLHDATIRWGLVKARSLTNGPRLNQN